MCASVCVEDGPPSAHTLVPESHKPVCTIPLAVLHPRSLAHPLCTAQIELAKGVDPAHVDHMHTLLLLECEALGQAKRVAEAENACKQASELKPEATQPHRVLSRVLQGAERFEEAVREMHRAAEKAPEDDGVRARHRGVAYGREGAL